MGQLADPGSKTPFLVGDDLTVLFRYPPPLNTENFGGAIWLTIQSLGSGIIVKNVGLAEAQMELRISIFAGRWNTEKIDRFFAGPLTINGNRPVLKSIYINSRKGGNQSITGGDPLTENPYTSGRFYYRQLYNVIHGKTWNPNEKDEAADRGFISSVTYGLLPQAFGGDKPDGTPSKGDDGLPESDLGAKIEIVVWIVLIIAFLVAIGYAVRAFRRQQ